MKKIYILTAVFALLTLSLNAQLKVSKRSAAQITTSTEKVVTPPDGFFRMGPSRASTTPVTPPYSNGFDNSTETSWWQVIDANSDGSTWTFSGQRAVYTYNSDNAANDWLITAPVYLEVGKIYKFYIKASRRSSSYMERLEVKLATANNETALSNGATIIAATDVTSLNDNYTTFSNENVTVTTSGNYYFGIHAISIADRWELYVDDLVIDVEDTDPKVTVSRDQLTISDSGTNNTFDVEAYNIYNGENLGVTPHNGFSTTCTSSTNTVADWGFYQNNGSVNGTVAVNYTGRALTASDDIAVGTLGASTTIHVDYVPNLYIYCDNGVSPWNFSANPAVVMTNNGDGTYTATLKNIPANSHILFGRADGLTYNWEGDNNRLFFGASTDGGDWGYGGNTSGNLDTDAGDDSPVKYHPIYFSEGGTYSITIDANANTFTITELVYPAPENVVATADSENQTATVTWDAPSNLLKDTETVTEDFEDTSVFPAYSVGGISATQHTGAFGDWTLYEPSGANVFGDENLTWPNESAPHAWQVFPASTFDINAHSGDQFMLSIDCVTSGGNTNHWLISPELSGAAQTISFYVAEITTYYGPETYEIWVSSTDNTAPGSFTKLGDYSINATDWTLQSVSLPAGTKYFAIRHTSYDIYGMMVDDVTYEGLVTLEPVSYNVYLDGELVGNVNSDVFSYTFNNVSGEHECAVSAVYPGGIESAAVPATFAIQPKAATPTITYEVVGATVVITATGEGTITLTVGEQTITGEGPVSITVVRSPEDRAVTATAFAQESGKLDSDPATQIVTIPALASSSETSLEGLLRLHLLMLDQMLEEIPENNSHPDRYGYVLRYEPNGPEGQGIKESGSVDVHILKTDCEVLGKYTLKQIDEDTKIGINHDEGITMNVFSADVKFDLSNDNPDIDFYLLESEASTAPEAGFNYVTKLQQTTNFTYVEMLEGSPEEGEEYQAGEHFYNDQILVGAPGDFMRYAPVVSTWGVDRRYFEDDGLDNTYGAPLWKTGVGDTKLESATAEKQIKGWNTSWKDGDEKCSLYMLDKIDARGYLPAGANVEYEPYMFRVFVESPNGKLRKFTYETVVDEEGKDHEVITAATMTETESKEPWCVWSAYVNTYDDETLEALNAACDNQFTIGTDGTYDIQFCKNKVDRTDGYDENGNPLGDWDKQEMNAIFGALDALNTTVDNNGNEIIDPEDLTIFVRFYYIVKGTSEGWTPWVPTRNAGGLAPVGYGAESPGKAPGHATAVNEIQYLGEIVSQTYYNMQGMVSDKPFDGVNIVVTRFGNGTTSVSKIIK